MANTELVTEKKHNGLVNGSGLGEEMSPVPRPKVARKGAKKSRTDTAVPVPRYFLGSGASTGTPQLAEERTSEVEIIADAFRKQVSFFVVQEFTVDVQNHNGAPLLRKNPVKDRSSP
jgi:hypothetical protein